MRTSAARGVKRLLDLTLCLLTLPITVPVTMVIALAVKLSDSGPVLYHAPRIGRGGEPFDMLKFRTMTPNRAGPRVTTSDDPRITPLGRWLRDSKLDELPQLINVIRGEMSLVGPRPEDPRYVACYRPEQREVLSVPPGLANLTFLRFGHEQTYLERVAPTDVDQYYRTQLLPEVLDIELGYVRGWTLLGDLRILVGTLRGLLPGRGGAA